MHHSVTEMCRILPKISTITAAKKWILRFRSSKRLIRIPFQAFAKLLKSGCFFNLRGWKELFRRLFPVLVVCRGLSPRSLFCAM